MRWPTFPPDTCRRGRSGGWRWHALAVAERPLWLLDEPTVSLDAASGEVLVAAINAHLKSGGMAVIATHVPMALEPVQAIRLGRVEPAKAQP